MRKNFLIVFFAGAIFATGFYFLHPKVFLPSIQAGPSDNVSGYAWSENIGWVSFNCTDSGTCGSVDYGVRIDSATGNFSGFAWSENIGWIKFNPTTTPPGESFSKPACLDLSGAGQSCDGVGDNLVSGWARACTAVADKTTCEGAADPAAGGWDGWIKMRGTTSGGSPYGVLWNSATAELEGWAWSDMVLGWLSFNCKDTGVCGTSSYKVLANMNQPPSPGSSTNLNSASTSSADPVENPGSGICTRKTTLSWTYSDPGGNPQLAAEVQVAKASAQTKNPDGTYVTPVVNKTGVNKLGPITSLTLNQGTDLPFNDTYVWQVRVQDNQLAWSAWVQDDASFTTILHDLPTANFTFTPSKPSVKEPIQFTDTSLVFGGAVIASSAWQFKPDGNPGTSTVANPVVTFPKTGFKPVTLNVTDSDILSCIIDTQVLSGDDPRRINMKPPLPKFFPVIPF